MLMAAYFVPAVNFFFSLKMLGSDVEPPSSLPFPSYCPRSLVFKTSSGISPSDASLVGKSHSFIDYNLGITSIIGAFSCNFSARLPHHVL